MVDEEAVGLVGAELEGHVHRGVVLVGQVPQVGFAVQKSHGKVHRFAVLEW